MDSTERRDGGPGTAFVLMLVFLGVVAVGGAWLYGRARAAELDRAEGALRLQVLTSRLGAAALQAEYGSFDDARSLVSGVFDGIQNYGIERGELPESYAEVLAMRDEVITDLARSDPAVADRLVGLFFRLQIPVTTELDPERIIPATDTGAGLAPPVRRSAAVDSAQPRDAVPVPLPTATPPTTDTTELRLAVDTLPGGAR